MASLQDRKAEALQRLQSGPLQQKKSEAAAELEAREQPGMVERAFKGLDDAVRSIASGATFGLADEIAAGASSATGIGDRGGYSENLAAERARDRDIPAAISIPGQITGGVLTGSGLAKGGLSLLQGAKATLPSLAGRGAAEGALYGAAYGFGSGEGARGRMESAATGAALGGLTGAATGAAARAFTKKPASAVASVKDKASQAYKAADQAGVIVKSDSFSGAVKNIEKELAEEGFDKTLHPRVMTALSRLNESKTNDQTLKGLDILRRVMKNAAASNDPSERRMASIMIDKFDDYIGGLRSTDVVTGDVQGATKALREARKLWSQARKGQVVEDLVERAGNRAGQFTGSGFENALRNEFRTLSQNAKRLRQFAPDEQKLIRRIARGTFTGNTLRAIGRFAGRGPVSAVLTGSAGHQIGGAPGAVAALGIGEAGRIGATAMTSKNVKMALDKVLGQTTAPVTLSPMELNALRSVLIGEQATINRAP